MKSLYIFALLIGIGLFAIGMYFGVVNNGIELRQFEGEMLWYLGLVVLGFMILLFAQIKLDRLESARRFSARAEQGLKDEGWK